VQQLLTIVRDAYSLLQHFQDRWVLRCTDKAHTTAIATLEAAHAKPWASQ
jgi:hypothetical protein